jgi:hypothetical protein
MNLLKISVFDGTSCPLVKFTLLGRLLHQSLALHFVDFKDH